jgi:O-antigen/teichoic acid export membrane protein
VALTPPVTAVCAVFADDLIAVLPGSRWTGSADIFPILAPAILVFAIANPLGWLLNSLRLVCARFEIAVVLAPFLIVGYMIALPHDQKKGSHSLIQRS